MKNIFQELPQSLEKEVFEVLVNSEAVKIERIVSKGHSSPQTGWYNQEQNEWVIVLQGDAIVSFEHQEPMRLIAGDYVNIPAHQKHRVDWTDPNLETIWLAVHY